MKPMKRLFSISRSSPQNQPQSQPQPGSVSSIPASARPPSLPPKYRVPVVPHPRPYDHIAILATPSGLLLRPHSASLQNPTSHVRVHWSKDINVEEVHGNGKDDGADWNASVVVYGIVGVLEMYSASYLLVISSRRDSGNLLHEQHAVYGVKGITAIPLIEERATIALNTLASKNAAQERPSILPLTSTDTILTIPPEPLSAGQSSSKNLNALSPTAQVDAHPHRVKFADEEEVKVMTPGPTHTFALDGSQSDESPPLSGASTPSSETAAPSVFVAKTIANRLSFWGKLSKRTPQSPVDVINSENAPVTGAEAVETSVATTKLTDAAHTFEHPAKSIEEILDTTAPTPQSQSEQRNEVEEKVVREVIREFTRGGMYFAYNFDMTRSLQHKQEEIAKSQKERALLTELNAVETPSTSASSSTTSVASESTARGDLEKVDLLAEAYPTLPLWRRVDRKFWWNEWMCRPFVDAGLHPYVLPIMQGYYQGASFHVAREPESSEEGDYAVVDYIIVSRRSKDRAGLRYQRRGIDNDAHVANFVETEAIMRVQREGISNVFSYVQIRGSIPLFWSQPGYSLKPAPVLATDRTHQQNLDAIRTHFQKIVTQYGPSSIINLAEQHGKEGAVTTAYRDYVTELGWPDAKYHEYDFHAETKGMKYENISHLIDQMERTFEHQGYLWISNGLKMTEQKGVYRVNCIDCLDRTNVVQSAFARHVLNRQLGAVALLNGLEEGRTETDVVFNDVWANNGDAISRAYAGTSALKGDFTRTGKRDLGGMLNDGLNSLARMYTSTFSDWFCQAVIDYMLGYRTLSVFSEFLHKLETSDPRDLLRVTRIRQEAIATTVSRVLPEGERLLSGWTVFSPEALNVKISDKFEEKVLLLSARSLYIASYDYNLDKVKVCHRVPLGDIKNITKGAYILSPLEESSRDTLQNAGFIVRWESTDQETRVTSYSVRNTLSRQSSSVPSSPVKGSMQAQQQQPNRTSLAAKRASALSWMLAKTAPAEAGDTTFMACKALPIDPTRRQHSTGTYAESADDLSGAANSKEAVDTMVDSIARACHDVGNQRPDFITEGDIVSLAEAQKMTSVYAKMEYGVKRLLWLGG